MDRSTVERVGIAVLGPLAVDGVTTGLGRRDRVVLEALAVQPGEVLGAEQLADALWPDRPPASWPKVVQGCVVRLRKVLGPQSIETSARGYRLAVPADGIDAQDFERLVRRCRELLTLGEPERASYAVDEALRLWRGRPLIDLDGWDAGRIESERLEELHLDAEELRMEAALQGGNYREVMAEAHVRVAEAPARERRWALLATAQYQAGRQDEALGTLRRVRRYLADELGLDPGAELLCLEHAVLHHDPSLVVGEPRPSPGSSCPYLGLVPYDVDDSEAFFGRTAEVAECLRRLADAGVLVVAGPSGGGKSSLVRAGVAAALRREGRAVVVVSPGHRPMDALTALTRTSPPPVLVVDQLEEAIALCDDAREQAAFFAALAEHSARAELVVALRADRMGAVSAYPEFARLVERGLYLLGAMNEEGLRAAILAPAHQAGLLLEGGLVDLLVREVEGEPGALPLLSHALHRTWERREGRVLTVDGYRGTGGIRGAVAQSAEELYARVAADQRPLLRDLLLRLVAPSNDGEPIRSRVPRRMVAADAEHDRLVELLVDARLVTSDDGVVELAHEALARAWPRLREWLDDDTAGQRIKRHVADAADAWDSLGRPDSELYRGARLAQALDWRDQGRPLLTPTEQSFLASSQAGADEDLRAAQLRAERESASRRRTRRLATVLAAVLCLALVAAGTAMRYQRDAAAREDDAAAARTLADANRLAALSTTAGSLDLSLLLAAEAAQVADTPETRDGLLTSLVQHRRATRTVSLHGRAAELVLGNRGRQLFADVGPRVVTWEVGSAADASAVVDAYDSVNIDASPTDDLVVVLGFSKDQPQAGVYRADGTRQLLVEAAAIGGWPFEVAFTSAGRGLLFVVGTYAPGGGFISSVRRVDLATGSARTLYADVVRSAHNQLFLDATFAADGSSVVAWTVENNGRAVLLDLTDGSRTNLRLDRRPSDNVGFIPLPTGVARLWADGAVTLYGPSGRPTQVLSAHGGRVEDILVAPDASWAASSGVDGAVILWNVDPASGLWTRRESLVGHDGPVTGLELAPGGRTLFSGSQDQTAIAWDLSADAGFGTEIPGLGDRWITNRPDVVIPGRLIVAPTKPVSPAGDRRGLAVEATFIDVVSGAVVDRVAVGDTTPEALFGSSVSVSPDRRRVAVTSGFATTVLDADTREVVGRVELPPTGDKRLDGAPIPHELVWSAGWTRDGSRLLLGAEGTAHNEADGGLVVVDPATWRPERRVLVGGAVQVIEPSPDGALLAVAESSTPSDDTTSEVWILDSHTLETRQTLLLADRDFAYDLSFSPDGSRLAAVGSHGRLTVFDTATWRPAHEPIKLHDGFAQQVEWLPDGDTVATSGADGRVALYDAQRGLQRAVPLPASSDLSQGFTHLVPGAVDEIVVLSGDRPGRRYPMTAARWHERACAIAGRNLTPGEWARYLPDRPYNRTCA